MTVFLQPGVLTVHPVGPIVTFVSVCTEEVSLGEESRGAALSEVRPEESESAVGAPARNACSKEEA